MTLYFTKKRDAEIHDHKNDQEQKWDRDGEDQGTSCIDGESHDHGAEYDKRTSEQKTKSHIYTVLYLIDIISQAGDAEYLFQECQALYRKASVHDHRRPA